MYYYDRVVRESPDIYSPRTYRLAWKIVYGLRLVKIDAVTGEIMVDGEVPFRINYLSKEEKGVTESSDDTGISDSTAKPE